MIRIYIMGKDKIPENETCYIVGKDGIYMQKNTGLIKAVVKVPSISSLAEVKTGAELKTPKIPAKEIARALLFFRRIYKRYHTEAMVLLYYNKEDQRFYTVAPPQQTSGAGVDYETNAACSPGKEYRLIGSIHSHSDFRAFHSGTDTHDEADFDGVHITIGHVDDLYFDIAISLVVNNNRFLLSPEETILKIKPVNIHTHRKHRKDVRYFGIERVSSFLDVDLTSNSISNNSGLVDDIESYGFEEKHSLRWDLVLPENMDYRNIFVPDFWMENVSKKTYPKYQEQGLGSAIFSYLADDKQYAQGGSKGGDPTVRKQSKETPPKVKLLGGK